MFRQISEQVRYRAVLSECTVPLGLRSVGSAEIPAGESYQLRKTGFFQLIWGTAGEGVITIRGREFKVRPEHAALIPPEEGHRLAAPKHSRWSYRWCTFDGPAAGIIPGTFRIPTEPFPAGECPAEHFEHLGAMLADPSPEGERNGSVGLYAFLAFTAGRAAAAGKTRETDRLRRFFNGTPPDLSAPGLNVQLLADEAEVSRFTVLRHFKEQLGVTPKQYLDSLRLQRAFALLRENRLTIREIAEVSGFSDANYFAKFFRRKTGMTPSRFREERHLP